MWRGPVSPAGAIGALAIVVCLSGTAVAATGSGVLLGKTNTASGATTIDNPKGTALQLRSKAGTPPLSVAGNTTVIPNLNAALLAGHSGPGLRPQESVFSSAGSTIAAVPAGMHHALFIAVGGGGGGGGGPGPGGGGGQGAYAVTLSPVTPGGTIKIVVGDGGAGGTAGTTPGSGGAGSAGQSSSVSLSLLPGDQAVEAGGGDGGAAGAACPTVSVNGEGGLAAGPSVDALHAGSRGLVRTPGAPGDEGTWSSPTCANQVTTPGVGGAIGFAGQGGTAGTTSSNTTISAGSAGGVGLVIVEFLA